MSTSIMKQQILPMKGQNYTEKRSLLTAGWLAGIFAVLLLSCAAAIGLGARSIPIEHIIQAFLAYDIANADHHIIYSLRLPRVLAAIATGAGFAVSGAVIQGISRNPLADTGILGLNAGAGFLLVIAMIFLPSLSFQGTLWLCMLGAALSAVLVFGIGFFSKKGLTPLRLVLVGAAISALLTALSEGLSIFYAVTQQVAFWYGGGLSGIQVQHLQQMLPFLLPAIATVLLLAPSITLLNIGEETAQNLGMKVKLVTICALIAAFTLAGISCALAGSISFIGLLAPHIARAMAGADYRSIIPLSAMLGAVLVVLADLAARLINAPQEVPVGAVIAVIGIPFFLMLARRERRGLS